MGHFYNRLAIAMPVAKYIYGLITTKLLSLQLELFNHSLRSLITVAKKLMLFATNLSNLITRLSFITKVHNLKMKLRLPR